jgi:hypothetical protein
VNLNAFLAVENANQRVDDVFGLEFHNGWEARDARHAAAQAVGSQGASFARRTLAKGLAAVSRGSAFAVRRLDDVVADDLRRAVAPGK